MSSNYKRELLQNFKKSLSNYLTMSDMLKIYSYAEILECAAAFIGMDPEKLEQYPMGGYSKGMTSGSYRFVLQDLLKNITQYDWIYFRLEDDISRLVFANLIGYRILPSQSFLEAAYDAEYPQYFDKNIICCNKDEVFVDCGDVNGDTAKEFIRQFSNYKHIYVYEPIPENIQICYNNLKSYHHTTIRPYNVGEKSNILPIEKDNSSNSFMKGYHPSNSEGIQIVSLDEDIQEPITFLKMDIQGLEISALLGAKRHIRDDFPKLAICSYYIINNMWEIPRLIDSIHPGYRFFIRHYDSQKSCKTVVYAIPPEQIKKPQIVKPTKNRKCIVSLAFDEGWTNAQLVKDCGIIPYLFHKNYNCDAYMVGAKIDTVYSNIQYVNGLKMEFLPDTEFRTKASWLLKEASNIDCLQFYGCYPSRYLPLANIYKKHNPKGKISLALDANSHWMDRIPWTEPEFYQFMDQCDVISAAGHTMQRHLNEKWPWIIEYIPNGFYNFSSKAWEVDFEKKENTILTVGRLGTPQKRTNVLLEAFAQISEKLPDWKLRLAGSIEPEFESYLTQFWKQFPHLQHRIQFLGNLTDRDALYAEYQRAKIFALPSLWEGGTPNVIAEALYAGNAVAITKIDEHQDATDYGRCGLASEIDGILGFADILLRLCQDSNLENMCRHAYNYAKINFDMEKIATKLYCLIFGEEG